MSCGACKLGLSHVKSIVAILDDGLLYCDVDNCPMYFREELRLWAHPCVWSLRNRIDHGGVTR